VREPAAVAEHGCAVAGTDAEPRCARILQIFQLDQENEQRLLRCSLTAGRAAATPVPARSVAMLQKIYARCA
jgi:hypothetical protein